jgi:hypothetical protein
MQVNDALLAGDITAALHCQPVGKATSEQSPTQALTMPAVKPRSADTASIKQRLNALEALRREGYVSEAEFNRIRQRILNDL